MKRQEQGKNVEQHSPQTEQEQPSYNESITWAMFRSHVVLLQDVFAARTRYMTDFLAVEKGIDIRLAGLVLIMFMAGI